MNLTNKLINIMNVSPKDDINYQIAFYIKNNIDKIGSLKIEDLARNCYTSNATISRFIKNLGFDSYKSFREEGEHYEINLNEALTHMSKFKKLTPDNAFSFFNEIAKCIEKINTDDIKYFSNLMSNNKGTIYLMGSETISVISNYICQTSFYTRNKVVIVNNFEDIKECTSDDTVITITSTGSFLKNKRDVVPLLKQSKAYKFLLTTTLNDKSKNYVFDSYYEVPTCFEPYSLYNVYMIL